MEKGMQKLVEKLCKGVWGRRWGTQIRFSTVKPTCQLNHIGYYHFSTHSLLFQKKKRRMSVQNSEHISLALQFVASLFWVIGATLAGPSSVADYLQLSAAVAWCLANLASAWHIWSPSSCASSSSKNSPAKNLNGEQNVEMASRV